MTDKSETRSKTLRHDYEALRLQLQSPRGAAQPRRAVTATLRLGTLFSISLRLALQSQKTWSSRH